MRRLIFNIVFFFALAFSVTVQAKKVTVQPEDIDSITVLAPPSFAVPISELCKIYSLKTTHDVNAVFDSSADNILNIQDGDPADIVIIPSRKFFAELENQGLVDTSTTTTLAKNDLVVVTAKEFTLQSRNNAKDVLNNIYNKTLMVIADEDNDALGEYTVQSLIKLGMWDKFSPRVVLAANSSSTVDLIIKGQSAGIVFGSDAKLYSEKLNNVAVIPQNMHKPIEYLASVVVGEDMVKAKDFLKFLASKEAQDVFRKHGFVIE